MRSETYLAFCLLFLFANTTFAVTVSTTLDGTAPPADPSYSASTGLQTGRLNRLNAPSNCDGPKTNPGLFTPTGDRRYDSYVFTPTLTGCVRLALTGGTATIFAAAYNSGGLVTSNPSTNYLADIASSPSNSTEIGFFNVVAGQPFTVVVSEVEVGGGVGTFYTLVVESVVPQNINETLDTNAPTPSVSYTSFTGLQTGRLTRNGTTSNCTAQKPNPGTATGTGSRRYDAYRFVASMTGCVTVELLDPSPTFYLFMAVYDSNGFVPAFPDMNYLADAGFGARRTKFSFMATAGQVYYVIVHEVNPGEGIGTNYTLRVSEGAGQTPYDFDGDLKTEVAVFRPSTGRWWYSFSGTGAMNVFAFGLGTDRIVPGDYSGSDGRTDTVVWRPTNGTWYIQRSGDGALSAFPFGTNGDIPQPADYDGDGQTDAAVFRPSTNTWYIRRSIDGGTTIEVFGSPGDVPVTADYDGDGRSDIAIFRPLLGQWWLKRSSAGILVVTFGNALDKLVPADFTGDDKADVAIWRPTTGEWFILRSDDLSFYSFPFGTLGDQPMAGDFEGDGVSDPAVFRPSTGTWYITSSRIAGSTTTQAFGVDGDRAVPNAYVP